MPSFETSVRIRRDPEGVARWWFEFPANYSATDPREQPYQIETIRRTDDVVEVMTHWRMMGVHVKLPETITRGNATSFDARIRMGNILVHDEFRLADDGAGGSVMRISTKVTGASTMARMMAPVVAPLLHAWMKRTWRNAALLCEEEAKRARLPTTAA